MIEPFEVPHAPCTIDAALIRRFWSKVDIKSDEECWPWKSHLDRYGYGSFGIGTRPARAHRMAWLLWNGEAFPPDVKMRHTCDNRRCCNPAHLKPGTQADNMQDRMQREGYKTMRRGEEHGRSKLTQDAVRAIRASNEPQRVLAARYGISDAHISRIRSGYVWAWLPQEP